MILAVIEHENTMVTEASLQTLAFARQFGDGELVALIIGGEDIAGLATQLGKHGVSTILHAVHQHLASYAPAAWARTVVQAMSKVSAETVIAAGTDKGNEFMAHLAAITDQPLATNCSAARPADPFQVTRLRWGSSLLEESLLKGDNSRLLTVALHVVEPQETNQLEPAIQPFAPDLSEGDLRVRLVREEPEISDGVTLKNANVVVGGGRGVGSPEAYAVLEELAGLLNGAVGCSRVATNNGWRPHSDQVGLTGTRISPALYIACGISGAIQHLVGCKGAGKIMVINKDPEAAFFSKADYGVLGDLHEILPAVIQELKQQRG